MHKDYTGSRFHRGTWTAYDRFAEYGSRYWTTLSGQGPFGTNSSLILGTRLSRLYILLLNGLTGDHQMMIFGSVFLEPASVPLAFWHLWKSENVPSGGLFYTIAKAATWV